MWLKQGMIFFLLELIIKSLRVIEIRAAVLTERNVLWKQSISRLGLIKKKAHPLVQV